MAIEVSQPIIANGKPRIDASYGPWEDWDAAAAGLTGVYKTNSSGINVPARILVCVNDVDYILTEQIIDSYTEDEISDAEDNDTTLPQKQITATTLQTKCTPYAQGGGITEEEVDTKIQTAINGEASRADLAYANKATQNSVNNPVIVTTSPRIASSPQYTRFYGEYDESFTFVPDDSLESNRNRMDTIDLENVLGYSPVPYVDNAVGNPNSDSPEHPNIIGKSFAQVNLTKNDIWIGTASQYRSALLFRSDEIANKTLIIITSDGSGIVNVSGESIIVPARPVTQNGEE